MSDAELIKEFLRVRAAGGLTMLEVAVVEWIGHSPSLRWDVYRRWAHTPDDEQVSRAERKAIGSSRYFRRCGLCGERWNVGQMHSREVCHGCAERHLGVIH